MMSRITLHLKKEAHKSANMLGSRTFELSSLSTHAAQQTPITYAYTGHRPTLVLSPLSISVQEHTVPYNDRRGEVQIPKKSHRNLHVKGHSYEADEQWFEYAPSSGPDGGDPVT